MAGKVTTAKELSEFYGGKPWTPANDAAAIERSMANAGPGARGIVFGIPPNGGVGHYFNVVNQNGTIRFLDGQIRGAANLSAPYGRFYVLRTN